MARKITEQAAAALTGRGYTGYSAQQVWELYLKAIRGKDWGGAEMWQRELLLKGADTHSVEMAWALGATAAPKRVQVALCSAN